MVGAKYIVSAGDGPYGVLHGHVRRSFDSPVAGIDPNLLLFSSYLL